MRNKSQKAFTLVELIVVITILAILGTIAFISLQWYSANARDSVRIANLTNMSKGLSILVVKDSDLPEPSGNITTITLSGSTLMTQWEMTQAMAEQNLKMTGDIVDPVDWSNPIYSLATNKKKFQIALFLEAESLAVSYKNSKSTAPMNLFNSTYSADWKTFITKWNKLWIVLSDDEVPVNQASGAPTTLELITTTTNHKIYLDDTEVLEWQWSALSAINPISSCKRILETWWARATNWWDGIYTINPSGTSFSVYCDMTTDWGGWTLVSYAGKINWTKSATTWKTSGFWYPLLFNWWSVQSNSMFDKSSFSRFDILKPYAAIWDEFMAKRTSVPDNIMIFPIQDLSWFWRDSSEWHFDITSTNRDLPYLKLSNSWIAWLKTVTNNVKWSYLDWSSSHYPWIDWNVSEADNCDNCGRSYETWLSHRSLLYWESQDSRTQWSHATPLSMTDSLSPINDFQDIEFWYREQ